MTKIERRQPTDPPARCHDCPLRALGQFVLPDGPGRDVVQDIRHGTRKLDHGALIHGEGDPVSHAFTLFDGYAVRYRMLSSGQRQVLQFVLAGDLIYHLGDGPQVWPDAAEVVDHAVLCALSGPGLQRLFEMKIEVAHHIAAIRQNDKRLLEEHIMDMGQRSALEGVARLLLELFLRERQRVHCTGPGCYFPFRQHDIGDALGLSSVHVSRVMADLREAGLVTLRDRWLTIPDVRGLAARLGVDADELPAEPTPRPLL
jgi:CRP-like cAMP-binding protein